MKIIYSRQDIPEHVEKSIFLAGPTPREPSVQSWRPQAIKILEELFFDGTIFLPEDSLGSRQFEYDDQIDWEWEGLQKATCILFWIPRELIHMPAFTTNIEWGKWYESGKVVLGYPPNTPKMGYFKYCASKYNIPVFDNLNDTIKCAVEKVS